MQSNNQAAITARSAEKRLARTHCKRGHPYSGDNLYTNSRGHHECRTCRNAAKRKTKCSAMILSEDQAKEIRSANLSIGQAIQREKTHCPKGHEYTAENILPYEAGRRRCAKCYLERVPKSRKNVQLPPHRARLVIEAIDEGATVSSLTGARRGKVNTKICSWYQLQNFLAKSPRLKRRLEAKLADNAKASILRANQSRRVIAAPALIRNNGADAYQAIMAATGDLAPEIRNDVQGDMFIAIAEGRLRIADISARVQEFRRARNREDRNSVFNPWGHLSLDKPLNDDSDATFMDVIRGDQRLWL